MDDKLRKVPLMKYLLRIVLESTDLTEAFCLQLQSLFQLKHTPSPYKVKITTSMHTPSIANALILNSSP